MPAGSWRSRGRRVVRIVLLLVAIAATTALVALAVVVVSFRDAVGDANERLPDAARAALDEPAAATDGGSRNVLLVGADTSAVRRSTTADGPATADSMLLVRIDPERRTVHMLSLPRDLFVPLAGGAPGRIGEAYTDGGLAAAIATVQQALDVEVHHVALVDFDGFRDLVDAVGGITVDNPSIVRSGGGETFDGRHWSFEAGRLELDGRDALAFARIRKVDELTIARNPDEAEEVGRGFRQQLVLDGLVRRLTIGAFVEDPLALPRAVVRPVTTDLEPGTLVSWARAGIDASSGLRCRLGGTPAPRAGTFVLMPGPDNARAVEMFEGARPSEPPGSPMSAGCYEL